MKKITTATLDNPWLLISNKKQSLKKIGLTELFTNKKKIINSRTVSIRSNDQVEFGHVEFNIYYKKNKGEKPSTFYFLTTNALDFIDAEKLIKTTKESWNNIGQIKIEKEKIVYQSLSKTKKKDIPKDWNKTLELKAENGIYEFFTFDYYCEDAYEKCDTMFVIKKLVK
ncbi:hypothetical protein N8016_01400 [Pelagibacteraceae bacterium]|nr:hypothetical protein [Pelagibacteraceae bacterium]